MKGATGIDAHDAMVKALFEEKSLEALVFLLEAGRELEFSMGGNTYFISRDKAQKYVSVWKGQEEQSFHHMYDLIEYAVIEGRPFFLAWKEAKLQTLF